MFDHFKVVLKLEFWCRSAGLASPFHSEDSHKCFAFFSVDTSNVPFQFLCNKDQTVTYSTLNLVSPLNIVSPFSSFSSNLLYYFISTIVLLLVIIRKLQPNCTTIQQHRLTAIILLLELKHNVGGVMCQLLCYTLQPEKLALK